MGMTKHTENPQPNLFELLEEPLALAPAQQAQLATLVEALLREIAVALASSEVSDD
jgi:hypothetical protein